MKKKNWISLLIAFIVFFIIIILPQPEGLSVVGQRALGVFAFAIIVWLTEAVPYTVSAIFIGALIAVFMGLAPDPEAAGEIYGTSTALGNALTGFSSTAWALVAAALFIAVAMKHTGLHERLALTIMARTGTKPARLVLGVILVSTVLAFFVPSATARAGAIVPIILGIVSALDMTDENRKNLTALLMITAILSISFWNVGIMTAAAQNFVALGFLEEAGISFSWIQWFIYAAPWAIIMNIILFFLIPRIIKVDMKDQDSNVIQTALNDLGPASTNEKKLMLYSVILLILWATGDILHPFDATTVTIVAFAVMLAPGTGVYTWKDVQEGTNWGTLLVFAVGISLGSILLNTGGAAWLSERTLGAMGLGNMPLLAIVAILSAINILIHLGFASATSLASAFIPIVMALVASMGDTSFNGPGLVLVQQFVISFGFILPVSAPQNMLAYGTGGYEARDLMRVGIPITIIGYLLILLLTATYWPLVGLL